MAAKHGVEAQLPIDVIRVCALAQALRHREKINGCVRERLFDLVCERSCRNNRTVRFDELIAHSFRQSLRNITIEGATTFKPWAAFRLIQWL